MHKIGELPQGAQRDALRRLMRQVRASLQRQAEQLNEETAHVRQQAAWVREWEASLAELDGSYRQMLELSRPASAGLGGKWGGGGRREEELHEELARIAAELTSLVAAPNAPSVFGGPFAPPAPLPAHLSSQLLRQHHEQHFVDFGREGLRLPAAQPRAAVNTAGAAAWLGQRERVQSLMQSHARWLRKLRHSIAHAE
ncbi:Hypothetical protein EMIHUDRAFT_248706 [Emiliania huxleyi CCMP1516]|uniref:Uncharacterized protein n=2 Tax=Emiliania huxleyi TaxID=2903 RepID=A0A0D3IEL6_EMIH1|nr:Hypothetical protein EMIHUDRAFT_248706 [Emiliania huxleyi CCMP1516]EOD09701.1 Hypothetical protein EMIHUDRAFT_248706 [Emiliania huxleyi CCMP1516]|eukprot:XP_005762130.1 Hypothetical protein EMIHUDRAFT_248706 [Emiliania huxleyi CCMP1516]